MLPPYTAFAKASTTRLPLRFGRVYFGENFIQNLDACTYMAILLAVSTQKGLRILEVGSREFYNSYFRWVEMLRKNQVDKIIVTVRTVPIFEIKRVLEGGK